VITSGQPPNDWSVNHTEDLSKFASRE
jgi:hypothetical protein